MRYFVFPNEGLSDDLRAALTRGLGLSPLDFEACELHCRRYDVEDVEIFAEELAEAQAALATARQLGAPIMVDWRGYLCFDLPRAPSKDEEEEAAPRWQSDAWLSALFEDPKPV